MSNATRVMWNGTVRALPFGEQVEAARIAGCSVIAVTPSDYDKWLGASTKHVRSQKHGKRCGSDDYPFGPVRALDRRLETSLTGLGVSG
jgi:hypothetical protein